MGQATSVHNPDGSYRIYHYPYSTYYRMTQFPCKFYLKYAKLPRICAITVVALLPLIFKIQSMKDVSDSKKEWKETNAHYNETWFDRPKAPVLSKLPEVSDGLNLD